MAPPDEVPLWKAPQKGRDAIHEITSGYDPDQYPGDGPYFALDKALAVEFEAIYGNGLQEIRMPRSLFDELVRLGVIRRDTYYPTRSCHVPPVGLPDFNEAINQGTPNEYHPPKVQ